MTLAANAVSELCKPNPSSETVEYTTKDFVKTLDVSCYNLKQLTILIIA